ncbi:PGPGW domain-containing protein [Methylocystis echinoides]|jgi:hypothetical protein|uniref:PGPGW domain-containing protein n=1 Tax=Methylocystis echinoides TaxID=29468 RepID=UPI003448DDD4
MVRNDAPEKDDGAKSRNNGILARIRAAPSYVGVPVGVSFILGGTLLAPLPFFGVWMVPLGLAILAPHSPGAHRLTQRLYWQKLRFLRWAIRRGFVRVRRVERKKDETVG